VEQVHELVVRAATAPSLEERVEAYGRLVERFRDMACGYAYSIVGDFHLAEDVAQEAFIMAFGKLGQLQQPEAFPGWFRRIVWSACGRVTRRKTVPTTGLDVAENIASPIASPHEVVEQKETRDEVLKAIRQLPDAEREVTALFYINGYSQRDIADFLEVPLGTVKNRLSASRSRLKERMLNMVKDTLQQNAPDERFDKKVIERLVAGPKLLGIKGNPVREAFEAIKRALPHYTVVTTEETLGENTELQITQKGLDGVRQAGVTYHPDEGSVLRTDMTWQTLAAVRGMIPPIRLLAPGRVFNAKGWPEASHLKVGHVCGWICIEPGYTIDTARSTIEPVICSVLGSVDIRLQHEKQKGDADSPIEGLITFEVRRGDQWWGVCRGGILSGAFFRQVGFDPAVVGGAHFGFGLDRLAIAKNGIDDIRKLWQPPYIP
jgi:RNA polymerase sigma factor (sigma-70 family)